jgi:hypothetical protein
MRSLNGLLKVLAAADTGIDKSTADELPHGLSIDR